MRIGFGYDIHRFEVGREGCLDIEIPLGGVYIPSLYPIIAHSDGDLVLHAVVDAVLGAAGLGDIGCYYPPSEHQWKDKESVFFVRESVYMVRDQCGLCISNADVLIVADPGVVNIKSYRDSMRFTLANMLGVQESQVNVKAKSKNMSSCDVGQGRAAEAFVSVLLCSV